MTAARLSAPDAIVKAALFYASHNVAVFPCFGVIADGEPPYLCECPDGDKPDDKRCGSPGKHPRIAGGFKNATTDRDTIIAWWRRWPNSNVASPTGIHWDVVDVDGSEGVDALWGDDSDVVLPDEIGRALTEREEGHHVYIEITGAGNRGRIYPAVDFRGIGGYTVLPPSLGKSGRRWRWTRPVDFAAIKAAA